MAQRRMFNLDVIDTDNFIEMPISSRLLYYELGMRADDDGFVKDWKKILTFSGLKEDDMKVLVAKNYIIPFETGIIVIRHWRLNNYLQSDRKKETVCLEEKALLTVDNSNVYNLYTNCIHSIDKYSIDYNSIEKENIKRKRFGNFNRILLTDIEYQKLVDEFGEDFINNQIRLLDEYIQSNNNKNKYSDFNLVLRKSIRENWFKQKSNDPVWLGKDIKEEKATDEEKEEIKEMLKEFKWWN